MADTNALISALLTGSKGPSAQEKATLDHYLQQHTPNFLNNSQIKQMQNFAAQAPYLNPPAFSEWEKIPQTNPNTPNGLWNYSDQANKSSDPRSSENIPPNANDVMDQLSSNQFMTKNYGWNI